MLKALEKLSLSYKKDGATWFKTTTLGKEKDRVYIKKSGEPTYWVPDTAYHKNKIDRVDAFKIDTQGSELDILKSIDEANLLNSILIETEKNTIINQH